MSELAAYFERLASAAAGGVMVGDGAARRQAVRALTPAPPTLTAPLLVQVLDVLAIGVVVLDAELRVGHVNRCAAQLGWSVSATGAQPPAARGLSAQGRLVQTIRRACAGLWGMAIAEAVGHSMLVAAVPLVPACADEPGMALLVLSPDRSAAPLMLQFFARAHGLTPAETTVLEGLGRGLAPAAVARSLSVSIATVRTHVTAIRGKTGAANLRALVAQVLQLPPVSPSWGSAGALAN